MILAQQLQRAQKALKSDDPQLRSAVLDVLGWGRGDAAVLWTNAPSGLGQCYLGVYPTAAAVDVPVEPSRIENGWWKPSYFSEFRWCLQLAPGMLRWCDLYTQQSWTCKADDLAAEPLLGLTPEQFVERGRLQPDAPLRALEHHPGKRATDYFLAHIESWWKEYLENTSSNVNVAKKDFTRLLSALLLLRTIEDTGRVEWLRTESLRRAVRTDNGSISAVQSVFRRAAAEINSRVLRGVADVLPAPHALANLINRLYEIGLDFSEIEVDPVGRFYENVLGTDFDVQPKRQLGMFGENREVRSDSSVRRQIGAYYTPREYADLLARRLVLPAARNARNVDELPVVLDIAAGSGQLLCAALRQIVSLPQWRRPVAVRHLLEHGLYAVDVHPLAPQLAALNVLRTAILLAPELLDSGLPFPPLDRNFIANDGLCVNVLDAIPEVDFVLLNPPYKAARRWEAPPGALPAVQDLAGTRANYVFAFLAAAVAKVRSNGGVGALMPVQLLTGIEQDKARAMIAHQFCLETIITNEGARPFGTALSYPSLVIGYKAGMPWRPRVELIEIPRHHAEDDLGALVSGAGKDGSQIPTRLIEMSDDDELGNWTGQSERRTVIASEGGPERVRLADLLGPTFAFHQAPSVAPRPWGRELFLFEVLDSRTVRHQATSKVFSAETPSLRPVAFPNDLYPQTPIYAEPRSGRLRVFVPWDGSAAGVDIRTMKDSDPVAYAMASAIRKCVLDTPDVQCAGPGTIFKNSLRNWILIFNRSKGFVINQGPLLVLSKASRMPGGPGHEAGVLCSVWVNVAGDVVPIEGVWARFSDVEYAFAVAALLNNQDASAPLLRDADHRDAPVRNEDTKQPRLATFLEWPVPPLSLSRYQPMLRQLREAFVHYRRRVSGMSQAAALATEEFSVISRIAEELWRA